MNAAVSADRDYASPAMFDAVTNLLLEIANVLAQMNFERKTAFVEQFAYARAALASTTAACGRVEEEVNGLD
jgi:hypothetical protein